VLEPLQITKKCRTCSNEFPYTPEFFYQTRVRDSGKYYLKSDCKKCDNTKNIARKALRKQHPTHRDSGEDHNGFRWDKILKARFQSISHAIFETKLTPDDVLALSPARAKEISYNLGARLKLVKYAIRENHREAMQILFPTTKLDTEPHENAIGPFEPEALNMKSAAERLIACESRLEAANLDLLEARKMLEEAENSVRNIRAERNEAVRFLSDFLKELELDDNA
jgi:hypothetical protein